VRIISYQRVSAGGSRPKVCKRIEVIAAKWSLVAKVGLPQTADTELSHFFPFLTVYENVAPI
jgi:hypothetical protein